MPITGAAIIGGSSILSGVIGNQAAAADRDAANASRQQALQQFLSVNVPDPALQKLYLEHYQQTGQLAPELEQLVQQKGTSLNDIQLDPATRQAQMSALQKLAGISDANGLDDQAKAQTQQAINATNANEKGQRDAIVQNFAQRGQMGSGAQLQAQLLASQGDANIASQQGMTAAAAAQQRALAALASGATLSGQIRGQDYSQAADAAKAQDAINQFNARNAQSVNATNTAAKNSAQQFNLTNQQNVANLNTGVENTQETHNQALYQQQFQDQMQRAAGASGQYAGVAAQDTANADRTANQWAGIGQAIGQGTAAYGQYKNNQAQTDAYNRRTDAMEDEASEE